MDANKKAMLRNIRQALVVTLVLLLLCGFVFPVLLSGLSGLLFPHQAGGSLVTADGKAVGAKLVGQEFTEAYFMKGRPSAYRYNTYYTDEQGLRFQQLRAQQPCADTACGSRHRGVFGGKSRRGAGGYPGRPDDGLGLGP